MPVVWTLRAVWLLLPVLAWDGVAAALDSRSQPVQLVIAAIGLAGWFAGLVALLAPSTISLTALRVVAPAAPLVLGVVLLSGSPSLVQTGLALSPAIVATGLSLLPTTGDVMVNGSAYGPERRMALRPPAALLLGPLFLMWLAVVAGLTVGPVLLAARNWLVGVPVLGLGAAAVWFGSKSLHQLSRRWIVFVPAGFVIHDYLALAESILLQRKDIAQLGPAPAELKGTADLSAGALGLALQVTAAQPLPIALRNRREVVSTETIRMVFTPSLPGQLLHEARVRGIKIG